MNCHLEEIAALPDSRSQEVMKQEKSRICNRCRVFLIDYPLRMVKLIGSTDIFANTMAFHW